MKYKDTLSNWLSRYKNLTTNEKGASLDQIMKWNNCKFKEYHIIDSYVESSCLTFVGEYD